MKGWYKFICPICKYPAERFDKYSEFWEDWWWEYCSYECYKKSKDYKAGDEAELWLGYNI